VKTRYLANVPRSETRPGWVQDWLCSDQHEESAVQTPVTAISVTGHASHRRACAVPARMQPWGGRRLAWPALSNPASKHARPASQARCQSELGAQHVALPFVLVKYTLASECTV
jgi:hypothetical protein